jgi:hypothetical protein
LLRRSREEEEEEEDDDDDDDDGQEEQAGGMSWCTIESDPGTWIFFRRSFFFPQLSASCL